MAEETGPPGIARGDLIARILELGLAAVVVLAPLPQGSVREPALSALELGAFSLGILWLIRATLRPTRLPPLPVRAALAGLLLLGVLQAVPLGSGVVGALSPRAAAVRTEARPPADALEGERRLLGSDPARLDRPAALSVDPPATASALRTGAALAILLLVAVTVVTERGAAGIALALLVSAALQGLYGTLAVAAAAAGAAARPAADPWLASGTFVNKNHYAGFLAAALPAGIALVLGRWRRLRSSGHRLARLLGGDGSLVLLLGLLALVGLAGLLLSFSRAGIALGALGVVLTFAAVGRRGLKARLAAAIVILAVAAVPLAQLGAERLVASYGRIGLEFTGTASRGVVWRDTLSMAAAYPAAGTGFGTFSAAYPLFRSPGVRAFFAHAHNDPLQVLAEGGIPALGLLALLAAPMVLLVRGALAGRGGTLAAGIGAGLLAVLLHSLVDFNFHIPSNAATAAILAGALIGCMPPGSARRRDGDEEPVSAPSENGSRLRLVAPPEPVERDVPGDGRRGALALGAVVLAAALAATMLSARAARTPFRAAAVARDAIEAAFDSGPAAAPVRAALETLRGELGRRPLDAATRAAYASLLLELAASPEERRAAAFHAARAVELAPVTVPVVDVAARVLARSGDASLAVDLVRKMFVYDPSSAADLYAAVEPNVAPAAFGKGLPDDPGAWVAWMNRLRASGRAAEAEELLDRAAARWPRNLPIQTSAALRALGRERWDDLRRILEPDARGTATGARDGNRDRLLSLGPEGATLVACRSRLLAAEGDRAGARADAGEAVRLAPKNAWIRLQAGISIEASGDAAEARAQWERGLFELVPSEGNRWLRAELLTRLARLEDRVGRPADALRAWRAVLDLYPTHAEARRRIEDLSGP